MSYQVIARKYRPQRFEDVVGQEHVTQTLANAISSNRIAHAYLFVGPRGTGKTTIARIFAKCLNCTGGPKTTFPDDDPRVIEITEGRSLDVLEIDGASNRGIDEIRELRDTVKYAPAASRFKIYIIDEVHMLTKEAFNALLKTLEEPPVHVKFMFATTEPDKVLPTILSRCQRFDLRRIPSALIVKHLAQIAQQEGVKIEEAALHAIARGADGGMRDAESTLDQLISFCGQEIAEADVLSMFGLAAQGQIFSLTDAVLSGKTEDALRQLNDLARQGKELSRIVTELLNHFRNLLIFQVSKNDLSLIEASEAEAAVLAKQASQVSTDAITRIMEILTDCEGRLRDTTSKKILLEVTLLKMIDSRHAVSIDTVLKQLQQLRNEAGSGEPSKSRARETASAAPVQERPAPAVTQAAPEAAPKTITPSPAPAPAPVAAKPAPAPAPAPKPVEQAKSSIATPAPEPTAAAPAPIAVAKPVESTPAPAGEIGLGLEVAPAGEIDLEDLWTKVLESVKRASAFVHTYFIEAHPVSFAKKIFTIGFDPEFADRLALVDNTRNQALIQTKLSELGFPNCHVKFVKADEPPARKLNRKSAIEEPAPAPAPAPAPKAAAKPAAETKAAKAAPAGATAAAPAHAAEPAKPKPESIPFNKDDFKNDPLIQKALEIFKGQIIDVRS